MSSNTPHGFEEPPMDEGKDPPHESFGPLPEGAEDPTETFDVFDHDLIGFVWNPARPDDPLVAYKVRDEVWVKVRSSKSPDPVEAFVLFASVNEESCLVTYGTDDHPSYKWVRWNECTPPLRFIAHESEEEASASDSVTIIGSDKVQAYEHPRSSIQKIRLPVRQRIVQMMIKGREQRFRGIVTAMSANGEKVLVQSLEGRQAVWVSPGKTTPPISIRIQSSEEEAGDAGKATV